MAKSYEAAKEIKTLMAEKKKKEAELEEIKRRLRELILRGSR